MKNQKLRAFIICLVCLSMCVSLCACKDKKVSAIHSNKVNIICTVFPAYDFARQIAGERGNVIMLVPPGTESHSYEPTPHDMAMLHGCDLIVANGGVGEIWLETLLSAGEITAPVVYMLGCVELLEEESKEGMQDTSRAHEHGNNCVHECEHQREMEYDEHVWTSPVNAAKICQTICEALCKLDMEGERNYISRLDDYTRKLRSIDEQFRQTINNSRIKTMIFADRFPVRYFVEEYGLEYFAAFPGCAQETEPSAKTVAFLIDKVRQEGIGAVYYIEFSNEKMADVIVEDTGCKKLLFHSCHNVSAADMENGAGYLDFMAQNLENLKEGLS